MSVFNCVFILISLINYVEILNAENSKWMINNNNPKNFHQNFHQNDGNYQNLEMFNYTHTRNHRNRKNHNRNNNRKNQNNNKFMIDSENQYENAPDEYFSTSTIGIIKRNHRRRGGGGRGQRQRMNKNALRLLSGSTDINIENGNGGAYPPLFNIVPRSIITVNATCGLNGREEYCKLVDAHPHKTWATQCGICNGYNLDLDKKHPIEAVLDNSNGWWQSPTLQYGNQYEYVTITLDLKQVYQVFFIMLKAAVSPRPASWILERSMDNITFEPWQYFGLSDGDCRRRYGLAGQNGKYAFENDNEIICTTQFSKPMPLENGEIHVSLLKNRPGALHQSSDLMKFITARYIRIRFQGMHSTANSDNSVGWLLDAPAMKKRSFYSLKLIRVSGRLACHGHAIQTIETMKSNGEMIMECDCIHNTCGSDCRQCCPLYNQKLFREGTDKDKNECEKCQCNGHATSCEYDELIGGGVCQNCTDFTMGINCEKCLPGYFRPAGIHSNLNLPCEKCECDSIGSMDTCNPEGGECICREGFRGFHCELCDEGYTGEHCTKCSCNPQGTMPGGECEENCQCKLHVEGLTCSQCVSGYFGLRAENPEGCLKCYCSGIGTSCKSAEIEWKSYNTLDGWKVTDITKSDFAYPTFDNDTGNLIFGMYELPDVQSIYWWAPKLYADNKLTSYGSKFSYNMSWVVIRGDTSGKPTSGPNIILFGRNGMKIAYGDEIFHGSNALIEIRLNEEGWYHIPKTVKDIVTRLKRTEYHGDPVTRVQFMSVLSDIETILIRGTFHTDQVETILAEAVLYSGGNRIEENQLNLVEQCFCPPGYEGFSCEKCMFGYIRVYENSTAHELIGKCIPCPCNGHAEICNLEAGTCTNCMHNTFGERCERCMVGFFGNPMNGTPNDCKRCACPLLEDSNNFSPSCQLSRVSDFGIEKLSQDESEFICTQCPPGYVGDHCEMCDDGYYGDPTILGSKCLPCLCNGGPCDPDTGQCITCHGNTEGWRCERCKTGYWGDPLIECELCECYGDGSRNTICNSETGQCECKEHFTGLKCDECDTGYANLELECPSCECSRNGSIEYEICDPFDGQCLCKDGVEGLKCDSCQDEYYDLTFDGCKECHCHHIGSKGRSCDRHTGQCSCHINVTGKKCEKCQSGTWNLTVGVGCHDCQCDLIGSQTKDCHQWTGQCECKPGIGGRRCDQCQEGYFGFSSQGCKNCDICTSTGHICDTDTGRCICPPNSIGPDCQQCSASTWAWKPKLGCDSCNCDVSGSIGQSCDSESGQCICREGYSGRRCDTCAIGYFNYPECTRCNCNIDGSVIRSDGLIECDFLGQCPCKNLVTGEKCDTCRQATFGMSKMNHDGCTRCFCFGRSQECEQSELSWGHIRMQGARNLSVQYNTPTLVPNEEFEYVVVIQMEGTRTYKEDAEIKVMNGLNLIPSSTGNVSIGAYTGFFYPLYFQLPPNFYGDRTSSYGGFLRFSLLTDGCNTQLEKRILQQFPLVQIHSHNKLVLDYFEAEPSELALNETFIIPLHETYWKYHTNMQEVNRAVLMTALENIKHIFLRGTSWTDFTEVVLYNVHMDSAIYLEGSTNIIAHGIEKCHCPSRFDGLSCQDPGQGYYRWRNRTETETLILEDLIGRVVPCDCSGRSDECDRETGICINCRNNSGGNHCERCAEGFYGDPNFGGCKSCPCPETSRNFARGCSVWNDEVSCVCKPGYIGQLCDRCMNGYFGYPNTLNGKCESCNCNLDGIVSDECDEETGQCNCKAGVIGRACDRCEADRHILDDGQCRICDNCTLILLDYMDNISNQYRRGVAHIDLNGVPPPWMKLNEYEEYFKDFSFVLQDFVNAKENIESFDSNPIDKLNSRVENLKIQWRKQNSIGEKYTQTSTRIRNELNEILLKLKAHHNNIQKIIFDLNNYGSHDNHINISIALNKAKLYLDEIKYHDNTQNVLRDSWKCAWTNYYFYGNASDIVQDQLVDLEQFKIVLNNINYRLTDAMRKGDDTIELLNEADDINEHNFNLKNRLLDDYEVIYEFDRDIKKNLNNSLISDSETIIGIVENDLDEIDGQLETIDELRNVLNESIHESNNSLRDIKKHWVSKSWRHTNRLLEKSNNYAKQFQTTKDGARVALLASSAHQNISDAIESARQATEEAKNRVLMARDKLYPTDGISVIERGHNSLSISKQLEKDAIHEMEKTDGLRNALKHHEDKVDSIKSIIWQAGLKNNNISSSLEMLDNDAAMKLIRDNLEMSMKISEQMRTENRKAIDFKSEIYKLRQKFANLEPDWDTKYSLADENISETFSNIEKANITLNNIEVQGKKTNLKFQEWNNTVSKQLQDLKDKIAKARHAAEGIKISMESLKTKCIRSYMPSSYGLSTSNTIKLTFALNNENGNSPLIYIQGQDNRYIALEMVKRKIRLVWNLGGETGFVIHPMEIHTRDPKYDDAWYHIEANRTLNIGSLIVRRMTNIGVLNESLLYSAVTNSEHTRFFRTIKNRVWLGGVPNDYHINDLVAESGLNVIVHQVYIDNKPLGIWNFVHSEGQCGGGMLGAQETSSTSNARHFNGEGYAEVRKSRPRPYRKNIFALQMTFKTLDENALLFLAVDEKNNRSVSVTLNKGCIVFRIDYGDESKLEINTTKKYNTGKWVSIEAAREFAPKRGTENGSLKVNTEEPMTGSPTTPITSTMLPDLSKAIYYLGGVPPGFRSGTTKAPGADNPFMGCMMDVQINGETYDPLESISYFGIEQSCKDIITKAGFYGKGYIELPSESLRKRANAGFVFRTLQSECLLLLSAYPPSIKDDYDAKDVRGNYSISLIDGHIHVWLETGRSSLKISSNITLNDGEYHVINMIKFGRRIELWIDDELHVTRSLTGSPTIINMPKDGGGLYFGGAPNYSDYEMLTPTFIGLEGSIRDIVFNNRTIPFNEAISFTNVHIGRSGPEMGTYNGMMIDVLMKTEPIGKSFTAAPEGCQRVGSYSYEPNAFKFGDGQHSHSQLNIPVRNFWQKNFQINFDFRTFYPNGIILIAPGTKEKQKHFVNLLLKDGHLLLTVRGRRKEELKLTAKLNDGQWHHVQIVCQDRKLTMSVEIGDTEQKTSAQMKIPKKISASNMFFIGGLPDNSISLPNELIMKLESFKGCLRKIIINNTTQDLARPGKHLNVGQCFPRVEKGSYFPGDAYAVYKKNFHVGKYLELELEFRTSELNGVLLSVSEPVGFPALSLEIYNGNIIFSCDLGDGNPFRVESIFPSKYAICNNKWHNISALYDFEQIALRIDNHPAIVSLAQHRVAGKVHTKSSLYIGGLPDIAQSGTLLSRDNFKGCIRNVSIRNERRDWIDMDGLHNVLLNECLAVN